MELSLSFPFFFLVEGRGGRSWHYYSLSNKRFEGGDLPVYPNSWEEETIARLDPFRKKKEEEEEEEERK